MKRQTVAIDVDDVLAQGTEALRLEVNRKLGVNLLPEHYAVPGAYRRYYEHVWEVNGIADRIDWDDLHSQMAVDQSHILPFINAAKVLKELSERYKLVVVTAREDSWEAATRVWLQKNFPGVFTEVHFAGRQDSSKTKGEICVEVGASWLIDDNIDHAHTALEQGVQVILFGDYGWHKQRDIHEDIIRCKDWQAVLDYFDGRNS